MPFFATAARHMESLLADELRGLGLAAVAETRAGASFEGSLADAYRICLWSRVANRVLLPLARFPANGPEALYQGVSEIPWEDHLALDRSFAVHLDASQSTLKHSRFGALKVKDAIVDRFRDRFGRRPDVRTERPDLQIHVYLHRDEATVSLDLSGESLHRRGYREQGAAAPVKENLAAAILLRAGWPEIAAAGGALLDPMCGSGTLVLEGALIAADIAPGLLRRYWGFLGWRQHDDSAWRGLLDKAHERRAAGIERLGSIRGYDQNPNAVRIALTNLERAGLNGRVHFERRELGDCRPGREGDSGLVVVNPPYGERMGADSDLPALYARLGAVLKERFLGWRAAVFTGTPELGKHMGLRAKRMHSLYNGPIECRLLHFDVTPEAFVSDRPRALPVEERGEGAGMLANRLRKNLKNLAKWRKQQQIRCYRLYDADLPEYALAVDIYEGEMRWVNVQEYEAPRSVDPRSARRRLREAVGVIPEVLEIPETQLFFKVRRRQKGKAQYERLAESRRFHEVTEGGYRFLVNFEDYLDTGLYLDHRETRRLVGELAAGRHFLNLFAYTGTASVYAAKGGALSTCTLDMSRTYLDWARRNLALNGIEGHKHELVQADCLQWLEQAAGRRRFGLIFLDPPSFSTSKRMDGTLDVQRDHVALIRNTLRLLEPDGVLIFSTNLRRFRMDGEALSDLELEDISRATLPKDFSRNPRVHACWRIQKTGDRQTSRRRRSLSPSAPGRGPGRGSPTDDRALTPDPPCSLPVDRDLGYIFDNCTRIYPLATRAPLLRTSLAGSRASYAVGGACAIRQPASLSDVRGIARGMAGQEGDYMLERLVLIVALGLSLGSSLPVAEAANEASDKGTTIFEVLKHRGFLDDYMIEAVDEVAASLVGAAGRWSGHGINRPYVDGAINIYLVDSGRLPESNVLEGFDVELARFSLRGNALAHEETGILFVDTALLKSLVTAAQLFANSDVDTAVAVAAIKARGIDAFRELWDPERNPALETAEYTDRWAMLGAGALAFILAHEMGHIHLGTDNETRRRAPIRFKDKEDKDKHWVCSDLIDEKYRRQQLIERQADDFAVSLLREVLFPPGVLTRPLLRYEIGARWYIVYSLSEQLIDAIYATESHNVRSGMRLMLGSEIYDELVRAKPSSGKGSIHVFFPKSHPANIRRASESLGRLNDSPYSLYHGDPPGTEKDIAMFEMLLNMECKNLRTKQGRQADDR